ncbi:MAG: GtrA family protein [Actinomycetales bacterium]
MASRPAGPPAGMQGDPGIVLRLVTDQRLAFLLVGGFNTVVGFGWFVATNWAIGGLFDPRYGYLVVTTVSYVPAVFCAYLTFRYLVFRVRGHFFRDLLRFATLYLTGLGVNYLLLPFFHKLIGLPLVPAQLCVVCLWAVLSWFGQKHFAFRRTHAERLAQAQSGGREPDQTGRAGTGQSQTGQNEAGQHETGQASELGESA